MTTTTTPSVIGPFGYRSLERPTVLSMALPGVKDAFAYWVNGPSKDSVEVSFSMAGLSIRFSAEDAVQVGEMLIKAGREAIVEREARERGNVDAAYEAMWADLAVAS